MQFDVYLYNIPKVSEDGKVVPVESAETRGFPDLPEARDFAATRKAAFDRVVVMRTEDDGSQKMLERYLDGVHEPGKADDPPPTDEG